MPCDMRVILIGLASGVAGLIVGWIAAALGHAWTVARQRTAPTETRFRAPVRGVHGVVRCAACAHEKPLYCYDTTCTQTWHPALDAEVASLASEHRCGGR